MSHRCAVRADGLVAACPNVGRFVTTEMAHAQFGEVPGRARRRRCSTVRGCCRWERRGAAATSGGAGSVIELAKLADGSAREEDGAIGRTNLDIAGTRRRIGHGPFGHRVGLGVETTEHLFDLTAQVENTCSPCGDLERQRVREWDTPLNDRTLAAGDFRGARASCAPGGGGRSGSARASCAPGGGSAPSGAPRGRRTAPVAPFIECATAACNRGGKGEQSDGSSHRMPPRGPGRARDPRP